jgi:hypothetical protein
MDPIRCYNYDSFPLETKFGWMQTGAGANAAAGFGRMLAQLAADFAAADTNIRAGLRRRGIDGWAGHAARVANAAIGASVTTLAAHSERATSGSGAANHYGDSFAATKNAIPAPPEHSIGHALASETASRFAGGVAIPGPGVVIGYGAGVAADYVQQLAAYRKADELANDALREHEVTTRRVLAAFHGVVAGGPAEGAHPGVVPTARPSAGIRMPRPPATGGSDAHGATGSGAVPGHASGTTYPDSGLDGAGINEPPINKPGTVEAGNGGSRAGEPPTGGPATGADNGQPGHRPTVPTSWTPLPALGTAADPGGSGSYLSDRQAPDHPDPRSRPMATGNFPATMPALPDSGGPANRTPYRDGYRPLAPRPPGPMATADPVAEMARAGAATDRSRAGAVPLTPGAGGLAGHEREHRNNHFLPDDSPFRADDDLIGIPPPVIGTDYARPGEPRR